MSSDSTAPQITQSDSYRELSPEKIKTITFHYELCRAVTSGILGTASSTFLLVIAVSHFQAGDYSKAVIAAGLNYGLLLSPLLVFVVARNGWRAAKVASFLAALGALSFCVAAAFPALPIFVSMTTFGMICSVAAIPLLTQLYQDNYPADQRGQLFSKTILLRIGASIAFGYLAGEWLTASMGTFQWLLLIFAFCLVVGSYCFFRCPSRALSSAGHTHPFKGLRHLRDDALFRQTQVSWMLMGFANLMMYQLRAEYLANPKYGRVFETNTIALLTIIIPSTAQLVFSPIWGRMFDRMNFFTMRVLLNIGFAVGAITFFSGRDMASLVVGAIVFGIATAGGEVAWSLWVTKLAPPDSVAEYMSVHTFFTGVRGVLAPLVGYRLISSYGFSTLSTVCAGMILVASLLLFPEILSARKRRAAESALTHKPDAPVIEEISD
jgi:MFS family permease